MQCAIRAVNPAPTPRETRTLGHQYLDSQSRTTNRDEACCWCWNKVRLGCRGTLEFELAFLPPGFHLVAPLTQVTTRLPSYPASYMRDLFAVGQPTGLTFSSREHKRDGFSKI